MLSNEFVRGIHLLNLHSYVPFLLLHDKVANCDLVPIGIRLKTGLDLAVGFLHLLGLGLGGFLDLNDLV